MDLSVSDVTYLLAGDNRRIWERAEKVAHDRGFWVNGKDENHPVDLTRSVISAGAAEGFDVESNSEKWVLATTPEIYYEIQQHVGYPAHETVLTREVEFCGISVLGVEPMPDGWMMLLDETEIRRYNAPRAWTEFILSTGYEHINPVEMIIHVTENGLQTELWQNEERINLEEL